MGVLLFLAAIALIPAAIAQSKGRSFFAWYIYGFLLFIVAIIHAIVISPDQAMVERKTLASGTQKKCPYCAEFVKKEAKVCRFCGHTLPDKEVYSDYNSSSNSKLICPKCGTENNRINSFCTNCHHTFD